MSAGMIIELKPKINIPNFPPSLPEISYSVTSDTQYPGRRDMCNDVTDRQMNMHSVTGKGDKCSHHPEDICPHSELLVCAPLPKRKGQSNTHTEPRLSACL